MLRESIRVWAGFLHEQCAAFGGARRWPFRHPGAVTRQDRIQRCLFDPAFGWHFVRALHDLGITLPDNLHIPVLRQAYWWLHLGTEFSDKAVEQAYALSHPASARFSAVLDALLLCRDKDEEAIATLLRLPTELVHAYGELFFNVRDRLDDAPYLASIVYPETRLGSLLSGKSKEEPDLRQILLRIGYESGADEVMWTAGLVPVRERENRPGDAGEALQTTILDQANLLARHGRCEGKDLMKHAAQFVARQPPKPPLPAETFGIESLGDSIMKALMETAAQSTQEQMKALEERNRPQEQPK